jgi:hypothetical protein
MEFAYWWPHLHEETERERKTGASPYLKILPETIRERFNLLDLSTDYFDPWRENANYPSFVRRCSNFRTSTKRFSDKIMPNQTTAPLIKEN